MRSQWCCDQVKQLQEKCNLDEDSAREIERRNEFIEDHPDLSVLSTKALRPLIREKDKDIKAKAISIVENSLKRETPTGGKVKKKITTGETKKIIHNLKTDVRGISQPTVTTNEEIPGSAYHNFDNIPKNKYSIILADPPWEYQDKGCNGNCEDHYDTMNIKQICALPINSITTKDAILFLWTTYPMLKEALQLIEAWGFEYKSIGFQWVKQNKTGQGFFYGLGRWTRGNTEPCLIATKGKPQRYGKDVFQLIVTPIRGHSQKPDEQYQKIEQLMGNLPRIELFARQKIPGWDCWGNDDNLKEQEKLS